MKQWLAGLLVAAVVLAPFNVFGAYEVHDAQDYLAAHAGNPWSTMALSVLEVESIATAHLASIDGSSAIQLAAPIMAIVAVGGDPRTFGSDDYVAQLKGYHTDGQIGDVSTLNDDFFGVLALIAAGAPVADSVVTGARNFILSNQNSDGGWGFTTSSDSDTNMTAAAVMALHAAGIHASDDAISRAIAYLQSTQNSDGGFPYSTGPSDTSSTAWVVLALNTLSIDAVAWTQDGATPISYLASAQEAGGFFEWQDGSGEDSFSAVTTAYAVMALSGVALPVAAFDAGSPQESFHLRIEGSESTVCDVMTAGPTALDVVQNAADACGYSYVIEDTSFGPYLTTIGSDTAEGLTGWLYFVNYAPASVGAADYHLQSGDDVLWYFGDWTWSPTRLSLSESEVDSAAAVAVLVEQMSENGWTPLADADVYYGTASAKTGADGVTAISPADGYYKVHAEKEGFVRSNSVLLKVGAPQSAGVDLTLTVDNPTVGGYGDNGSASIAFTVTPSEMQFGILEPGTSARRDMSIINTGGVPIHVEAIVAGDDLFRDNLTIDEALWGLFASDLSTGDASDHDIMVSVPSGYRGASGERTGRLTIWAVAP